MSDAEKTHPLPKATPYRADTTTVAPTSGNWPGSGERLEKTAPPKSKGQK